MFVVRILGILFAAGALVDCILRPSQAFPAVDRQTKIAWITFLALALLLIAWLGPVSLLGLPAIVLVVYYCVDVRAKVLEITKGSRY